MRFMQIILIVVVILAAVYVSPMPLASIAAETRLDTLLASERIYQDYQDVEMLSEEELRPILDAWDEAIESSDLNVRIDALMSVSHGVSRGYRLEGAHVLRYGNHEIVERVTKLHLVEMERRTRMLRGGEPDIDTGEIATVVDTSLDGEGYADYLELLATLAESTFSPVIYDAELRASSRGGLRFEYLATVNPETTLQLLSEVSLRERTSLNQSSDILDHPSWNVYFGSVDEALKLLSLLCERSMSVVAAERERVLDFVRRHAKHYEQPVLRANKSEPKPRPKLDYKNRLVALSILDQVAAADDIYDIVSEIMTDAPDNPSRNSRRSKHNDVIALGNRIIERLERGK
ncbi:hypothetical protein ACFL1X_10275 [Candidatus Hydrogenedentota bacterium]